ncbi:MAG TPA: xanthine dehydrogenase family protein molybdopterin-binding subunit [Nitrososphaerales archaeon]|nr:xanthine dehydrogenase family protein molybdopterin-binding subunit [Nitrososphaerales archaeon]
MSMKLVGQSVKRVEDPRLLAGGGRYLDDLRPRNVVYADFVRSTYAHAKILKIDGSELKDKEGFVAFFTFQDFKDRVNPFYIPKEHDAPIPKILPLAEGKVRWVGEPVAMVVATTRYLAEDLAALVQVDYEPLESNVDPEKALEKDAPLLYEDWESNLLKWAEIKGGDVQTAFAEADLVIKERIKTHRHTGAPMENRGIFARYDGVSGRLEIWSQIQFPHVGRTLFSGILKIPEDRVHLSMPDVGGSFGLKSHIFPEDVSVCVAARLLPDRTVKWVEKRTEDISFSVHCHEQIHDVEVAAKKDGTILGVKDRMLADFGAYGASPWGGLTFTMVTTGLFVPGPYRIKNYLFEHVAVLTNKTPMGSIRGPGMLSANFVMERALDLLAHKLGLDPYEVRARNLIREEEFPYTTASGLVYDKCSLMESLKVGARAINYDALRKEHAELRKKGIYRGIGIASLIEIGGIGSAILGPSGSVTLGYEAATVRVEPNGSVKVMTGLAPHGQSSETTLAQAVSDELKVPMDKIQVMWGDTDTVPYGMGTWGSRGAPLGTSAAVLASTKVREKAIKIAASMIEARTEDIQLFEDGTYSVKGAPSDLRKEKGVKLVDIARVALRRPDKLPQGMEPGLEFTSFFEPEVPATWSNAMTFCEVELDRESGKFKIVRFLVVEDCGKMINPMVVDGQVHGGIVEGLGGAVFEEIAYTEDGQLNGGSFLDYLLPSAVESPDIEVEHIETFSAQNPSQTKGLGEGGTVVAPAAVANAVDDALRHIGGMTITEIPLKPEYVLKKIRA